MAGMATGQMLEQNAMSAVIHATIQVHVPYNILATGV